MGFQVLIDDNFHYQNGDHKYTLGVCAEYAGALALCRKIVDRCLRAQYLPGTSASTLQCSATCPRTAWGEPRPAASRRP
jgi:hypothetical protein